MAGVRDEYHAQHADLLAEHNGFRTSVGVAECPPDEFNTNSPWANLYLFPEVADYARSVPLDDTWHRLDSTVRTSEAPFDVAEQVPGEGKVIYLSLGSLGCMDVGLMQRLIDALATTEHRTVVSMGPLKDQMTLGPNMYGDQFLPQPSILPQCDLLITHGGNNTLCEGFHFGLPMIGLPLFWDQYDNAQRLDETGFGARLPTYDWTVEELVGAVDRLLGGRGPAAAHGAQRSGDPSRPRADPRRRPDRARRQDRRTGHTMSAAVVRSLEPADAGHAIRSSSACPTTSVRREGGPSAPRRFEASRAGSASSMVGWWGSAPSRGGTRPPRRSPGWPSTLSIGEMGSARCWSTSSRRP